MSITPLRTAGYDDIAKKYPELRKLIDAYNENFRRLDVLINKGGIDETNISNNYLEYLQNVLNIVAEEMEKWLAENGRLVFDKKGINPDFIKRFPNKIVNSGFEWYDNDTMEPMYWTGDGIVTTDSNWDGTVALLLTPGQITEQGMLDSGTHAGADPAWWQNTQTRVSFKHKGGAVRVRVQKVSDNSNYALVDNSDEVNPVAGTSIDYAAAENWQDGYHTFYFQPAVGGGKVKIVFENVDATIDVYLDAVQIEPDFTGKWPSLYSAGPRSIPMGDVNAIIKIDEYVEYALKDWHNAGVSFLFVQAYTVEPVVSVSVQGAGVDSITDIFMLGVKHIKSGTNYIGAEVVPIGPNIPAVLDVKIAITCICREVVV